MAEVCPVGGVGVDEARPAGGVRMEAGCPAGGVGFLLPNIISSVMSFPPWLGSRIRIWEDGFFSRLAGGGGRGAGTMMGGEGGYTVWPA